MIFEIQQGPTNDRESGAGFLNTKHRNDQVDISGGVDGHDILTLDAVLDQVVCQQVGRLVDLLVREGADLLLWVLDGSHWVGRHIRFNNASAVRMLCSVARENVGDGAAVAAEVEVGFGVGQELLLGRGDEGGLTDGQAGVAGKLGEQELELIKDVFNARM